MKKKTIIILLILTFSIYISNINIQLTAEENSYRPTSLEFTPHDPIIIGSDLGFDFFPGHGIIESPYIIEGYNITTTDDYGIYISGTTKYFIIRNCYVDALYGGIYIHFGIADGTATVINNTCENNFHGIFLMDIDNSTVANNTCSNNNVHGILLLDSVGSTVANNTCNNNGKYGIDTAGSDTTIINNICNNNGEYGIDTAGSDTTVINNACNNNGEYGIAILDSDSSTVFNNTCNNNGCGIKLGYLNLCVVTYNLLQENEGYGACLESDSDNNLIHHNTFVDNNLEGTSQACDNGTNNYWYNTATQEGNFWSDWSGNSYSIDGSTGAIDLYPLLDKPVIEFDSPTITDIVHSPSSPTELDAVTISATVTDSSGVQSVTLYFRINSGTWQVIDMTLVSSDIYFVTIGSFAISDTIEYYVSAVDNSVNHNEAINDNSGLYYSFTIVEVIPEFQILSLLLPTITFLFLVVGLVVLQRRKK